MRVLQGGDVTVAEGTGSAHGSDSRTGGGSRELLLQVRGLKAHFPLGKGWTGTRDWVRAVDGVDLDVHRGEVLGLVGESGSGKTTLGRSLLRLVEPTDGTIHVAGEDFRALRGARLRRMRRRLQIVFQDPYASLSPRMQIGQIVAEPIKLHHVVPPANVRDRVIELLERVGIEPYFYHRYPHEMSGGQRQRIAIARVLGLEPELIVADEPVSALDVSVQAQILNIFLELKHRDGIAMLFISHDVGVVERIADHIAVLYRGIIVERAATDALIKQPLHPYTKALLSAVPAAGPGEQRARIKLRGEPPAATEELRGCPFTSRCPIMQDRCRASTPPLEERKGGRAVACFNVEE
jgi:peptide/nickel transport system ATP-binding protein/oligopeptide transport system ATP-binding protein